MRFVCAAAIRYSCGRTCSHASAIRLTRTTIFRGLRSISPPQEASLLRSLNSRKANSGRFVFSTLELDDRMSITTERKQAVIAEYARGEGDTGSPEVQVAVLSERIANLTEHF